MRDRLAPYVLLPLAGALAAYILLPSDPVVYSEVVVPAARIIEREPPVEVRWRDRIVYRYIATRQVATAPGGAAEDVATFCAPAVAAAVSDSVGRKSDTPPPRSLLIRSGTHSPGWFWQRDELLLTGPTSTGDLLALDYHVRPGFSFRASGDSVLVRYPRGAFFHELAELAVPLITGALIGRALP